MYKTKPIKLVKKTGNRCRDVFLRIVSSAIFDWFIITCILLNTVVLALTWYDEPKAMPVFAFYMNMIFAGIFTVECVLKIIALCTDYFKSNWNLFDFIIVIGTFAAIILQYSTNLSIGS